MGPEVLVAAIAALGASTSLWTVLGTWIRTKLRPEEDVSVRAQVAVDAFNQELLRTALDESFSGGDNLPDHHNGSRTENQPSPAGRAVWVRNPSSVEKRQVEEYFGHIKDAKRESSIYFWVCLVSGLCGLLVLLIAAFIAIFSEKDVAIFTAICGALPAAISALFYVRADAASKSAADNLALLNTAVDNAERRQYAVDISEAMTEGSDRQGVLKVIAMRQLFPDATPSEIAELIRSDSPRVGNEEAAVARNTDS